MLGNNDLAVFKDKVDVLATFWTAATADAHKIRTFLANGAADDIVCPAFSAEPKSNRFQGRA